jgi:hypothetical protein
MAHKEACQVYIEQEIQEGLAQGKTPYSIGKDLSAWVEKLFETNIPARTIEQKARRIENATNVAPPLTIYNHAEITEKQELQEVRPQDHTVNVQACTSALDPGAKPGPGRPPKYVKEPEPWSCAQQMADLAISHLGRIPQDDPKRQEAFSQVISWIQQSLKKEPVNVI